MSTREHVILRTKVSRKFKSLARAHYRTFGYAAGFDCVWSRVQICSFTANSLLPLHRLSAAIFPAPAYSADGCYNYYLLCSCCSLGPDCYNLYCSQGCCYIGYRSPGWSCCSPDFDLCFGGSLASDGSGFRKTGSDSRRSGSGFRKVDLNYRTDCSSGMTG